MKKQPSTPVTALRKEYNLGIEHRIMNSPQPKIYPMVIYEILKNCSNESHKLSLLDIRDLLAPYCTTENKESQLKNVKRNIYCVMQFDERVMATKKNGDNFDPDYDPEKDASQIEEMWYDQDFTTTDINIISNAIINSKNLGAADRSQLLNKISRLNGISSSSRFNWTQNVITNAQGISIMDTNLLYHNLEYIYEAIENKKCISFTSCEYNRHKELSKDRVIEAFVPYRIIEKDGRYIVIGLITSYAKWKAKKHQIKDNEVIPVELYYFQVNKLTQVRINENEDYIPIEKSIGNGKKLKDYIDSIFNPFYNAIIPDCQEMMHYYERIDLQASEKGLDILIDHFGKKIIVDKCFDLEFKAEGRTFLIEHWHNVHLKNLSVNEQEQLLLILLRGRFNILLVSPKSFLERYNSTIDAIVCHDELSEGIVESQTIKKVEINADGSIITDTEVADTKAIDTKIADTKSDVSKPGRVRVTKVKVIKSATKKKSSSEDNNK